MRPLKFWHFTLNWVCCGFGFRGPFDHRDRRLSPLYYTVLYCILLYLLCISPLYCRWKLPPQTNIMVFPQFGHTFTFVNKTRLDGTNKGRWCYSTFSGCFMAEFCKKYKLPTSGGCFSSLCSFLQSFSSEKIQATTTAAFTQNYSPSVPSLRQELCKIRVWKKVRKVPPFEQRLY